ncbi:MAG: hypothetical protein HFI42_04315 [Lachnospiraceae bacterium]|nr:hypothetical protein [Lachnospiraceae bacterium]
MKELSEKELKQLYKKEIMTDIPELWNKIEENLAPRTPPGTQKPEAQQEQMALPIRGRQNSRRRWLAGLGAAAAAALLAIPVWQLQQGGGKNDNNSAAMEAEDTDKAQNLAEETDGALAEGEDAPAENTDKAPASAEGEGAQAEKAGDGDASAYQEWEEEFHLEAELSVEQVQTTMEGFLITGRIRMAEDNWFEIGEQATVFYEGNAYREADFSGTIRVLLDVEEANVKILKILP